MNGDAIWDSWSNTSCRLQIHVPPRSGQLLPEPPRLPPLSCSVVGRHLSVLAAAGRPSSEPAWGEGKAQLYRGKDDDGVVVHVLCLELVDNGLFSGIERETHVKGRARCGEPRSGSGLEMSCIPVWLTDLHGVVDGSHHTAKEAAVLVLNVAVEIFIVGWCLAGRVHIVPARPGGEAARSALEESVWSLSAPWRGARTRRGRCRTACRCSACGESRASRFLIWCREEGRWRRRGERREERL